MIRSLMLGFAVLSLLLPACSSVQSAKSFKHSKYKNSQAQSYGRRHQQSHPRVGKLPRTDIPLVVNPRVVEWINFWTGRARPSFNRYLQRSGRFMGMMRQTLREKGMPEDLVYISLIESGFRNDAKSWASAVGTWQFIRSTGRLYNLKIDDWIDERRDPEKAVEAAANYFEDLYEEFGDWYLAMAAYNCGPGRVKRAIRKYKSTDFWEISREGHNILLRETKEYVPKYIAATILAKDPARYGFKNIKFDQPLSYERAEVHGQTDLEVIAKAAGVPTKHIANLNPVLRAGATPPGKFVVQVPVGKAQRLAKNFKSVAKKHRGRTIKHKVRRGDTISQIARRYGVTQKSLKQTNGLRSSRIRRGQTLRIPGSKVVGKKIVALSGVSTEFGMIATVAPTTTKRKQRVAKVTAPVSYPNVQFHRVKRGERLSKIAKGYGLKSKQLREWNQLSRGRVNPGQILRLRPPVQQQALVVAQSTTHDADKVYAAVQQARKEHVKAKAAAKNRKVTQYKVRRGDVLSTIARKHGVSVRQLKHWNNLRSDRIRAGQRLAVMQPRSRVTKPAQKTKTPRDSYLVKRGDSLSVIARRHGLAVADLRAWNGIIGNKIKAGQSLRLKPQRKVVPETVVATTQSVTPPTVTTAEVTVPALAPAGSAAAIEHLTHVVKRGDTLWDISREYKVSTTQIKQWNDMKTAKIKPGQTLTIKKSS